VSLAGASDFAKTVTAGFATDRSNRICDANEIIINEHSESSRGLKAPLSLSLSYIIRVLSGAFSVKTQFKTEFGCII